MGCGHDEYEDGLIPPSQCAVRLCKNQNKHTVSSSLDKDFISASLSKRSLRYRAIQKLALMAQSNWSQFM